MVRKLLIIVSVALLLGTHVKAQTFTISGYLRDTLSHESLIGATVEHVGKAQGTSANVYGFYSFTLPKGEVNLKYSFVGYKPVYKTFYLQKDTAIDVYFSGTTELKEVEITTEHTAKIQEKTQMSTISLPIFQIKSLPAFLGEVDVLKTLQLLPGIQSGGEGMSGFYVRGGGPDQNLILLDGVPVYNASHLFGFFSVFNADAINNVEVMKGGFPARYGGRASSVVDINMKEGNSQKFHGAGSIGFIAAKLTLEGPIIKDKTSFILSARRTYIDALIWPFLKAEEAGTHYKTSGGYYFYDLTAKINHRFSSKDRLFISAYMGRDNFYFNEKLDHDFGTFYEKDYDKTSLNWGNITAAARWNHLFSNKLFANTTLTYSQYQFEVMAEMDYLLSHHIVPDLSEKYYFKTQYLSTVKDWAANMNFDYLPNPDHTIKYGIDGTFHTYSPGVTSVREDTAQVKTGSKNIHAGEFGLFIEDEWRISPRLQANFGFRWTGFVVDKKLYQIPQPRIALRYLLTPDLAVKGSFSTMGQYVHLLTNATIGLPTDLWVPSTKKLKPEIAHQVAVGLAYTLKDMYEISWEGYYKNLQNVTEYHEGTSFLSTSEADWEQFVTQGRSNCYGMEFFLQKKMGSFTGWVGYTLSWAKRQFDDLNHGNWFYYKYDRRHDISIALMKRFAGKIELSGTWVYGSGNWMTVPYAIINATQPLENNTWANSYFDYNERNSYQMRPYHRLDLSISFIKEKPKYERRWIIGVYNLYNRKNPFYVDISRESDHTGSIYRFKQFSLFPIIPSISYQFKF